MDREGAETQSEIVRISEIGTGSGGYETAIGIGRCDRNHAGIAGGGPAEAGISVYAVRGRSDLRSLGPGANLWQAGIAGRAGTGSPEDAKPRAGPALTCAADRDAGDGGEKRGA